jgi:hypothetical protein
MGVTTDDTGVAWRNDWPMKMKVRYVAPLLAAIAFGAAVAAAPIAVAAPSTAANTATTAPAPPTPPGVDGTDPLVAANTGADPLFFLPPGYDLPS